MRAGKGWDEICDCFLRLTDRDAKKTVQGVMKKLHPTTTKLKVNNIDQFDDHILEKKYRKFTKQEDLTAACRKDSFQEDILTEIFHQLAAKIFGTDMVGRNSYSYLRRQMRGNKTGVTTGIQKYQNRIEISGSTS